MLRYYGNNGEIFLLALILALASVLIGTTEAILAEDGPDVILKIYEQPYGQAIFQSGEIGKSLWAPGKTEKGIVRIYNDYFQTIEVNNLALTMKLEKLQSDGSYVLIDAEKGIYRKFAQNMRLSIKRGFTPVFANIIYDNSFYEMLDEGHDLPVLDRFYINRNKYVDLEYTVQMAESAGNELQGLKATVDFVITTRENPENPQAGGRNRNEAAAFEDLGITDLAGHWAYDCMVVLLKTGIIEGYSDLTIRPENYLTRAEAAVLIGRALQLDEKKKLYTGYVDQIPDWARGYVIATTEKGILKGYPSKLFKPHQNITREEMICLLIRGFEMKFKGEISLEFSDKDEISEWALEYIKSGVYNEVIEGFSDNTIRPQNKITRAEAFTIICKLLGYQKEDQIK